MLDLENLGAGANIGWRHGDEATITLNTAGNIGVANCLNAHGGVGRMDGESETFVPVAIQSNFSNQGCQGDTPTLTANAPTAVALSAAVRRLTPVECERLQGFPDGYTAVPYRDKQAADGPRYRALGNSMAVPVLRWLLTRIEAAQPSSLEAVA
jgi:DNA (cytosine-5)-methyltransferase 1